MAVRSMLNSRPLTFGLGLTKWNMRKIMLIRVQHVEARGGQPAWVQFLSSHALEPSNPVCTKGHTLRTVVAL